MSERIRDKLETGWSLLGKGCCHEATDLFGRILLLNGANDEARRGLELARAAAGEEERLAECLIAEAEEAAELGESSRARRLVTGVLATGNREPRTMALLDRLDARSGYVGGGSASQPRAAAPDSPRVGAHAGWSRRLMVFGWTLAFSSLGLGVASSWEGLMGRLTQAPAPSARLAPPTTSFTAPSAGEQAVAEARRLMDDGDLAGALTALDRISPAEPAYPFARRLRREVETALLDRGYGE